MNRIFALIFLSFLFSCKTTTYFISRHAEKLGTSMTSDPPLTAEGQKQALDLRNYLLGKKVKAVYSTNFIRTVATARPTADLDNLPVQLYSPARGNQLVDSLKAVNQNNILLVGHSNTVDDLVNRFMNTDAVQDLPESEYGSLFIVKKKGGRYSFQKIKIPKTEPR